MPIRALATPTQLPERRLFLEARGEPRLIECVELGAPLGVELDVERATQHLDMRAQRRDAARGEPLLPALGQVLGTIGLAHDLVVTALSRSWRELRGQLRTHDSDR